MKNGPETPPKTPEEHPYLTSAQREFDAAEQAINPDAYGVAQHFKVVEPIDSTLTDNFTTPPGEPSDSEF